MAIYTWPADLPPTTAAFYLEHNAAIAASPLTRAMQVMNRPGVRWVCRMEFRNRGAATAARIETLLARLEGPVHEVLLFDFRRPLPRGTAAALAATADFTDDTAFTDGTGFAEYASAPTLSAVAAANADALHTEGWATSETVLLAGDYVCVAGRLHMVIDDVISDSGGDALLRVRPRLRAAVGTGARLRVIRPPARFRLTENAVPNEAEAGPLTSYSLSFVEAIP